MQIEEGKEQDKIYLSQKLGKDIPVEKIIVLISESKRYYVVASIIEVWENNLDHGVLPIYAFLANKED